MLLLHHIMTVITRFDYEAHLNEGLQVTTDPLRFF